MNEKKDHYVLMEDRTRRIGLGEISESWPVVIIHASGQDEALEILGAKLAAGGDHRGRHITFSFNHLLKLGWQQIENSTLASTYGTNLFLMRKNPAIAIPFDEKKRTPLCYYWLALIRLLP